MPLQLVPLEAPPATALASDGTARALAAAIGQARQQPTAVLVNRAKLEAAGASGPSGRVVSAGRWRDDTSRDRLGEALGAPYAAALRPEFEWYVCRGAFFHNDAHYGDVMFGVWCITGDMQLVFPRVGYRMDAAAGTIAVFDPFEVHGVLAPGDQWFDADRYDNAPVSVFAGFELDLSGAVRDAFGLSAAPLGRTIASHTRISPRDGALG